jgi:hypothetical protein
MSIVLMTVDENMTWFMAVGVLYSNWRAATKSTGSPRSSLNR